MLSDALVEYRVTARNTSANSENRIHDDAVARQYGFPGALVPGVTIYAYLTHPLTVYFGRPWLERGTAAVRFLKPITEGDEVVVAGEVTGRTSRGVDANVTASTSAGVCATAAVTVPSGLPTPVDLARYPLAPLPAERAPASRALLDAIEVLGAPETSYDRPRAAEYLAAIGEGCDVFAGPEGVVHPAFLLTQANRALSGNVRVGPWIHAASTVRHLGLGRVGDTLTTRGRVRSLYERKGREYVELDLVVVAGARRPIAHVLHTAIYRLPEPGAVVDSPRSSC
jgi:acyl dehydratase